MQKYKETLGNERFNEVIYSNDNGLGFFLGLDENSSVQIIEITKIFLVDIWEKREKDITARALTVV